MRPFLTYEPPSVEASSCAGSSDAVLGHSGEAPQPSATKGKTGVGREAREVARGALIPLQELSRRAWSMEELDNQGAKSQKGIERKRKKEDRKIK